MNFKNYKAYVISVHDWKEKYAELSKEIRKAKLELKELDRLMQKVPRNRYGYLPPCDEWHNLENKRDEIQRLKMKASAMIVDRCKGKILAQELYVLEAHVRFLQPA